jgi:hypothetical protein
MSVSRTVLASLQRFGGELEWAVVDSSQRTWLQGRALRDIKGMQKEGNAKRWRVGLD